MTTLLRRALLALMCAVITVHYIEESSLPAVEKFRAFVVGERSYAKAFGGCEALPESDEWIHPAALALTVYDSAQEILNSNFGAHKPEILPGYASQKSTHEDLKCIADYLILAVPSETMSGLQVRPMRYQMAESTYSLQPGWVSGLAQGFTGQVLLAAYLQFKNPDYLVAAREIGNLLRIPIEGGGVMVTQPDGGEWYEEYAQPGVPPPLVLNGHLLALDFLHRLNQADPENDWRVLFDRGVQATAASIDLYSGRLWSYYDRVDNLANHKYHRFHVRQLQRYMQHDPTGKIESAWRTMRWQQWVPLGIVNRLIKQPSNLIMFLTAVFTTFYFVGFTLISVLRKKRHAIRHNPL